MSVNGINDGSNIPPPGDHPEEILEDTKADRPARLSDVPHIGDGFHAGGSRVYASKPELLEERRSAWNKFADGHGILKMLWLWAKQKPMVKGTISYFWQLVDKIKGSDDEGPPPKVPTGGSNIRTPKPPEPPISHILMINSHLSSGFVLGASQMLGRFNISMRVLLPARVPSNYLFATRFHSQLFHPARFVF